MIRTCLLSLLLLISGSCFSQEYQVTYSSYSIEFVTPPSSQSVSDSSSLFSPPDSVSLNILMALQPSWDSVASVELDLRSSVDSTLLSHENIVLSMAGIDQFKKYPGNVKISCVPTSYATLQDSWMLVSLKDASGELLKSHILVVEPQ